MAWSGLPEHAHPPNPIKELSHVTADGKIHLMGNKDEMIHPWMSRDPLCIFWAPTGVIKGPFRACNKASAVWACQRLCGSHCFCPRFFFLVETP